MKVYSKSFTIGAFVCLIVIFCINKSLAQVVDPNFYPVITTGGGSPIYTSAIQSDGKIFYGGNRVLPDGKPDPDYIGAGVNAPVRDVKILPDGNILIAGDFGFVNGQSRPAIARLNANGTLDTTFTTNFFFNSATARKIAIQPDGKILVAGQSIFFKHLTRLNPDGSPDITFQNSLPTGAGELTELVLQPDGKFIVAYRIFESAWRTKLARYNPDGTADSSFSPLEIIGTGSNSGGSPDVDAILLLPDGKIIIGGSFFSVGGVSKKHLARINLDGSVDNSFVANVDGAVFSLAMEADGKLLAGGIFSTINEVVRKRLARLNPDGTLDETLSAAFNESFDLVHTISPQSDGKIVVGGIFLKIGNSVRYAIARLNSDGSVDTSFAFILVGEPGLINEITPRTDGKIYLGGQYSYVNGDTRRSLSRINSDGSTDASLPEINLNSNGLISAILSRANNKVVVGGGFPLPIRAFNEDGTADTNFVTPFTTQNSNSVHSLVEQPDGKVLVGGSFSVSGEFRKNLVRLNSDGSLDSTFLNNLSGPNLGVGKIALQPDGKIVITGMFTQVNGVTRNRIARLNADGSLDTTFQNNLSGLNNSSGTLFVNKLVIQPDGKILIGGPFETVNGVERRYLARLNSDGSLDATFLSGLAGPQSEVLALVLRPNGQIIIGGSFTAVNGQARRALAQLNSDGTLDNAFNIIFSGSFQAVYSLAVERNGNVLVGLSNNAGTVNGFTRAGLFRIKYQKAGFDFDGDGKADISVWRPSNRVWYIQNSSNNSYNIQQFGLSDDQIAPADYDGDGKTDIAVYRPSTGTWYWLNSSNNSYSVVKFGIAGDVPVPSDYDGDGKADLVVFRPSEGVWYRLNSSNNQFSAVNFGLSEDKPTVGDFDGDGKSDIAVWRPSSGIWYRLNSSDNSFAAFNFGLPEDKPTAADYDGDGKTDIAVFRPSNGVWYFIKSSDGSFNSIAFGLSEDKPTAADYDGDGKADIAVFRPSNGTWYILRSTQGFLGQQFGLSGDIPAANAFVR